MSRVSKEKIVGDIEAQLVQGAPSQELQTEQPQIAFWATQALNSLVAQECSQLLKQGKQIPPIYIVREACKQLSEEDTSCVTDDDGDKQRFYFTLTGDVLDIDGDNGIVQVLTNELDEIHKASVGQLPMFRKMRYTAPSSQVLLWDRQGDNIFIEGFKESDVDFNKIIVFYVPKQDLLALADTDEVLITDKLLPVLIERVVEIGKLQIYGTTADVTNNSLQDQQPVYARQVSNPSNAAQEQPQQQ